MRGVHILPTLAGALALGCADSQSPTSFAAAPTDLALSVERGTAPFGFAFADERYVLFIGLTVEDVTKAICTGGSFDVDEVQALTVTRPSDESVKALQRGTLNVVAIELAGPQFCDDPLGVGFAGTARVLYTDSDVFVSGNQADASQIQVTGTVTDASGQRYHLTAINVRVIAPGSTAENPVDLNTRTQIRLTPIGEFDLGVLW
jgi:hypothetical protein